MYDSTVAIRYRDGDLPLVHLGSLKPYEDGCDPFTKLRVFSFADTIDYSHARDMLYFGNMIVGDRKFKWGYENKVYIVTCKYVSIECKDLSRNVVRFQFFETEDQKDD